MKEMDENISKLMTIHFKNLETKIETVINHLNDDHREDVCKCGEK